MNDLKVDILEISDLYAVAESDLGNITWDEHHPNYPKSVVNFMTAISKSTWVSKDYGDHKLVDVVENIENATLEELKSALTRIARSERWVTGSWKKLLDKGDVEKVVKKAVEITT